jgi:hypothetical protein
MMYIAPTSDIQTGREICMLVKAVAAFLTVLLLSCAAPKQEEQPIISSPYTLDIELTAKVDTSLVDMFNTYVIDDRIPLITAFGSARVFPQIFPGLRLLSPDFIEGETAEAMSICYDTIRGRFYVIPDRIFMREFNEMVGDRFEDGITEEQAFWIAACAVYMKYRPRLITCRKADVFLEPRLRHYINETYTARPGRPQKEFSSLWWGWMAFPSANNDYRTFYSTYRDSILNDESQRDMPDDIIGIPEVTRDGSHFIVTFFGLPPGRLNEINRYRLRLTSEGHIRRETSDIVFYY